MLDAGLISALDDLFFSSSPPYESDTVVAEIAGNTTDNIAGNTVSRSPLSPSSAPAQAPPLFPLRYNANDWEKVESQGLQAYATWDVVNGEYRLVSIDLNNSNADTPKQIDRDTQKQIDSIIANRQEQINSINVYIQSRINYLKLPEIEGTNRLDSKHRIDSLNADRQRLINNVNIDTQKQIDSIINTDRQILIGSLDLSGCTALQTLDCSSNQLKKLDVSSCTALQTLNCSSNQLTELDVFSCTALQTLNCSSNQLTELDVFSCTALQSLDCSSNQLTFSTTQFPSQVIVYINDRAQIVYINCRDQRAIPISLDSGNIVDLSSEYLDGTTVYTWHYSNGMQVNSSLYTEENGKFTFTGVKNGDILYCRMTNTSVPGLTLFTTPVAIDNVTMDNVTMDNAAQTTRKQPEGGYAAAVVNMSPSSVAEKKDTLARVSVDKQAADYNTLTFTLPGSMIKKNNSGVGYTHIQIDIWGVKTKIDGQNRVPFWGTLSLEIGEDGTLKGASDSGSIVSAVVDQNGKLVLSGLSAGTKYSLQIQAVTLDGNDNALLKSKALKVSAATKKYTAVQKLKAPKASVTSSSVALEWQPSKVQGQIGAVTRYEIVWMDGGEERSMSVSTGTAAVITDLAANTRYMFVIRSISTVGGVEIASLSAKVSAKTL